MAGGFFFQKDEDGNKKAIEIPYLGRAEESGKSLGKEFYEKSLGIMTLGSLLCTAITFWRINSALPLINGNIITLFIGIAIFSLLGSHIYCAKRNNWMSSLFYFILNWSLGEILGRALSSLIPDFGLSALNKFILILGSIFLSVNGGIWLNSFVKTHYHQSTGVYTALIYIIAIQVTIGLICGFFQPIFFIEFVLMLFVLLGTVLGVGDASLSIEEGNWMAGVLAVLWYSVYIVLRFGRLIFYLLYILLHMLK